MSNLEKQVSDLQYQLKQAKDEAKSFQWHGKRAHRVLEKIDKELSQLAIGDAIIGEELRWAIAVVLGKKVDWSNTFEAWLDAD